MWVRLPSRVDGASLLLVIVTVAVIGAEPQEQAAEIQGHGDMSLEYKLPGNSYMKFSILGGGGGSNIAAAFLKHQQEHQRVAQEGAHLQPHERPSRQPQVQHAPPPLPPQVSSLPESPLHHFAEPQGYSPSPPPPPVLPTRPHRIHPPHPTTHYNPPPPPSHHGPPPPLPPPRHHHSDGPYSKPVKRPKKLVRKVVRKKRPFKSTNHQIGINPDSRPDIVEFVPANRPVVNAILTPDAHHPIPPPHRQYHSPSRFAGDDDDDDDGATHHRPGPPYQESLPLPPSPHKEIGSEPHHINFYNPPSPPPPHVHDSQHEHFRPTFTPSSNHQHVKRHQENTFRDEQGNPYPNLLGAEPDKHFFDDFAVDSRKPPASSNEHSSALPSRPPLPPPPTPSNHGGSSPSLQSNTQFFHMGNPDTTGKREHGKPQLPEYQYRPSSGEEQYQEYHHRPEQHQQQQQQQQQQHSYRHHEYQTDFDQGVSDGGPRPVRHSSISPQVQVGGSSESYFDIGRRHPKQDHEEERTKTRDRRRLEVTTGFVPIQNPYDFVPEELTRRLLKTNHERDYFQAREVDDYDHEDKDGRGLCVERDQARMLGERYPLCQDKIPSVCGSKTVVDESSFASFGQCLVETVPEEVSRLSVVADETIEGGAPRDDAECTEMVRSVFGDCKELVTFSCAEMKEDRRRATPVVGCLFAKYGDMLQMLVKGEE